MDTGPSILTASVAWNEHGCPLIEPAQGAWLDVGVRAASEANHVYLSGNRAGLAALGAWLLALADGRSKLDHQHFDNEVSFGFYRSAEGWELIVERAGK
jgi:hypothetical protein